MARSCRTGSKRSHVAGRAGMRTGLLAMAVVWLTLIAAPFGAPIAEEVTAERAGAAARSVLAGGRFQRELPPSPDADDGQDDKRAAARDDGRSMARRISRPPAALGEVARLLLWGLVAVVAILAIMFLINEAPHLRRRLRGDGGAADREAAGETGGATGRPNGGSLDEADRLARSGAHGEAIHVMLLSLVETLNRKIGRRLAHSLTGREIVGVAGLAERPGAALSRIVRAAERSHFGGRRSSRDDYDACRLDYLAVAEQTGTPE